MPEGDSVWRAARRLNRGMQGHRLARSDFRVPQHATADLAGVTVLGTAAHGKHMLTRFDDDTTLHTHFRMDGSWTVLAPGRSLPRQLEPDVRVLLVSERGQQAYGLSIPVVELVPTRDEDRVVGHLGPDPLRPDWDAAEAVRRLGSRPDRPAVAALLDQRLMAGLGNLWANELLFVRGHNPWSPVGELTCPPPWPRPYGCCGRASRCAATGRSRPVTHDRGTSTGSTVVPVSRAGGAAPGYGPKPTWRVMPNGDAPGGAPAANPAPRGGTPGDIGLNRQAVWKQRPRATLDQVGLPGR